MVNSHHYKKFYLLLYDTHNDMVSCFRHYCQGSYDPQWRRRGDVSQAAVGQQA